MIKRVTGLANPQRIVLRLLGVLTMMELGLAPSSSALAQTPATIASPEDVPIALLVDVTSDQVLFSREADRRFVPASITKVMTLFHAFELIEEGNLDPRQRFQMNEETWALWHRKGSTMFIGADDQVLVDDLLMGIANISANDGSMALAEGQAASVDAWLDGMNERARDLGMTNSHFGTPNGWPDEGRTFTNASDLVKLAKALISRHPQKYARYVGQEGFRYNNIAQSNRDPMIGRVEGADGIKTGYTNESGLGYLGSAKRGGQRLVLVVAGTNRQDVRAAAASGLIEWGFSAFDRVQVARKDEVFGSARVQNGDRTSVNLATVRPVFVNLPSGSETDVKLSIAYDGPLHAPIVAGSEVATLVVQVPGAQPANIPLVAQDDVAEAGFVMRIWNGIAGWFS
ncbi:MAG: D-alanyl-D-alanine carboxypeptidase family protein [Erythrobacter sp.]|uniref:D-alanyl-D-alanine carboxypeptidase family protein n=1 Tax=Erythrobacter sp. TaxID=1042 RepID=UPI00329983DD